MPLNINPQKADASGRGEHAAQRGVFRYFIECKSSLSREYVASGQLRKQLLKYYDDLDELYLNVRNKKVVLVIKEFKDTGPNDPLIKAILKEANAKGERLIIVTDLSQIKNLY